MGRPDGLGAVREWAEALARRAERMREAQPSGLTGVRAARLVVAAWDVHGSLGGRAGRAAGAWRRAA